jgi:hypothetical protein
MAQHAGRFGQQRDSRTERAGLEAAGWAADGVGASDHARFADFLVSARRAAGCSLDEIALATRVPARYLEALEQGHPDVLPRGVYRRAIVRTYATAVGLDPSLVLERFGRVFGEEAAFSEWHTASAPSAPPHTIVSRPVLAATATTLRSPAPRATGHAVLTTEPVDTQFRPIAIAATITIVLAAVAYLMWPSGSAPAAAAGVAGGGRAPAAAAGAGSVAVDDSVRQTSGTLAATPVQHPPVLISSDATDVVPPQPPPAPAAESRLVITSNPAGARVTVDGIGWGQTPITIRHLPPGAKVIRLTKDGYVAQQTQVLIGEEGGTATARLTLQPRD